MYHHIPLCKINNIPQYHQGLSLYSQNVFEKSEINTKWSLKDAKDLFECSQCQTKTRLILLRHKIILTLYTTISNDKLDPIYAFVITIFTNITMTLCLLTWCEMLSHTMHFTESFRTSFLTGTYLTGLGGQAWWPLVYSVALYSDDVDHRSWNWSLACLVKTTLLTDRCNCVTVCLTFSWTPDVMNHFQWSIHIIHMFVPYWFCFGRYSIAIVDVLSLPQNMVTMKKIRVGHLGKKYAFR